MATTSKTKSIDTVRKQKEIISNKEPKRLSKFALWRRDNPNGILEYMDWQAINHCIKESAK